MKKIVKTLVVTALMALATASSASHIFTTNPSINGTALDSFNGFTNPTIHATVGDNLSLVEGFYSHGFASDAWNLHFSKTSGSLNLTDFTYNYFGSAPANNPLYITFTEVLTQAGTFIGFLQPIQNDSCPSYRYGNGVEGGGGCGSASESLPFTLSVSSAVPEPTTVALLGLGLLGFAASRRKSAKSKNA
jgi:hypothetical protein